MKSWTPVRQAEYCKQYYRDRRDVLLNKAKENYYNNRQAKILKVTTRTNAIKHTEEFKKKRRVFNKAFRTRHPDRMRSSHKKWSQSSVGKAWYRAQRQARRARIYKTEVDPKNIVKFIQTTRAKELVVCYYCGETIPGAECHFDHMVPLAKGGAHRIENICVSCPKCNQEKHAKLIRDWMRLGQQLLEL